MTTAAKSAFGTTLTWNSQAVAQLNNIGGVEITVEMLDATNHSSTSGVEEVIAGIARTGEVTIEGDFKYDDANGQIAMVTDAVAKTSRTAVITFPNSLGIWTFTAFISRIKVGDNPIDGKIPFSASFKITGVPALTVTASAGLTTPFFVISESAVVAPAAAGDVYSYVATVLTGVTSVTVTPTATAGTITVNGNTVATGVASSAIALGAAGTVTTVTIVVTETGKTPKTYTIYIARAAS